jgi:dTDP-4-dehydrorhamnose reductase
MIDNIKSNYAYLVVGGDSLVGEGLLYALEERGHRAYSTTRRIDTLNSKRVKLDFEKFEEFIPPSDVDLIFVVAAATNYERCEKDPLARKINVELIPRFVEAQLQRGLFVIFISTNSVFGGERPWPAEDDPHLPGIPYAQQKSEAEAAMRTAAVKLGAENRLAIVRLTKILDPNTSPLPNWFSAWNKGEVIEPFEDLIFAPMSVQYVGRALSILGEKRRSGNLHLSGAENVSYVKFAQELANAVSASNTLIAPTTSIQKGINIAFKPTYSGLGMARTTNLTGVLPQTLESVIEDLLAAK